MASRGAVARRAAKARAAAASGGVGSGAARSVEASGGRLDRRSTERWMLCMPPCNVLGMDPNLRSRSLECPALLWVGTFR